MISARRAGAPRRRGVLCMASVALAVVGCGDPPQPDTRLAWIQERGGMPFNDLRAN